MLFVYFCKRTFWASTPQTLLWLAGLVAHIVNLRVVIQTLNKKVFHCLASADVCMLVHVSVSAVITANHRAMPDPNECLHFFSVCVFFPRGIRWLKDSFVSLHLLCLYCLNVVFFPASVSRRFSCGVLLQPFQPPRRQGWITAGDKSAGHQSYRRVQFTVSYMAAAVSPSASISSYVTCGKDENSVFFCSVSTSPSEWWETSALVAVALCFCFTKGKSVSHSRSSTSDRSHVFIYFIFFLFNLLYPKPKRLVNQPRYSLLLHSFLKIYSLLAFLLHTLEVVPAEKSVNKLDAQRKD